MPLNLLVIILQYNDLFDSFEDVELYQLVIIVTVLLVIFIIAKTRKKNLHANWNILIDDFSYSSETFYDLLTQEIKASEVEHITIQRVKISEGHILSNSRIYLRLMWHEYTYDCCLAPFGKGTFVSWWLYSTRPTFEILLAGIPGIGDWLVRKLFPMTYYKYDTASMFRTYAQQAVLDVIDEITKDTTFRMTEQDRRPNIKELIKR